MGALASLGMAHRARRFLSPRSFTVDHRRRCTAALSEGATKRGSPASRQVILAEKVELLATLRLRVALA